VLCNLQGTKEHSITYQAQTLQDNSLFYGFADAAFADTDDYKSTLGHVFLAVGGAISWCLKKQTVIALSSTEAGRETCWLRNMCEELGFLQIEPTKIWGDNMGAVSMARNLQFHKRSKYIATKWHWICDLV